MQGQVPRANLHIRRAAGQIRALNVQNDRANVQRDAGKLTDGRAVVPDGACGWRTERSRRYGQHFGELDQPEITFTSPKHCWGEDVHHVHRLSRE